MKRLKCFTGVCLLLTPALSLLGCGAGDEPFVADTGLPLESESICGDSTDWQDVEQYDGTLGPSESFVDRFEGSTGYIPGLCTGTLISYNLFLTAGHCFSSAAHATAQTVRFNYQEDASGSLQTTDEYDIVQLVEHRDEAIHGGSLDYAIVRLEGSPGYRWGYRDIAPRTPTLNEAITLIQHPSGLPKKVEGGTVTAVGNFEIGYNNLDTLGGSSGSGVLDSRGHILAVHERGGCDSGSDNGATRLDRIADTSSLLGGTDQMWLGNANRTFSSGPASDASGTYVPIGGDFDGDGRGDIFWYGRGGIVDTIWYSDGDGTFSHVVSDVDGSTYVPIAGDFDGDGRDDIFWYGPGSTGDSVWYGNANRTFTGKVFSVGGSAYKPFVGDFNGNGRDDIFWYGPGDVVDTIWYGNANDTFTSSNTNVSGSSYIPVAGDFDADGDDDIFWYGPGNVYDSIWWSNGGSFAGEETSVSGHYAPFVADFDGDGNDDIFWYGPGANADSIWYGNDAGTFTGVNTSVSGLYKPVTGRFNAGARADIYWYRPG